MDKTISSTAANLYALALTPFVLAAFFLPHVLLWGQSSLQPAFDRIMSPFLLLLALSLIVHELLHGLGFTLAGRLPWRQVNFGVKGLMVYAHCKVPLRASAYRIGTALPGLVLGFFPGLVGVAWGRASLTVYGALMCIAALGDVVILWLIRSVPGETRIQDHPSEPGCQVVVE